MAPIIQLKRRACEREVAAIPSKTDSITCPNCTSRLQVFMNDSLLDRSVVTTCVSCGHDMFYVQKDFNRKVGVGMVVIGTAVSVYLFAIGEPFYAMAVLFTAAILDFLVYRFVGDVTVCYACHAVYRGFEPNPTHEAFDLKKLEKYGGRDSRLGNN